MIRAGRGSLYLLGLGAVVGLVHMPMHHTHRPPTAGSRRRAAGESVTTSPAWRGSLFSTSGDFSVPVLVRDRYGRTGEYDMILDTGSSNFAVGVAECASCGSGRSSLELNLEHE